VKLGGAHAQNAQATARLNRLLAYVQLYKALGGGWNVKDPQMLPGPGPSARAATDTASSSPAPRQPTP
jgi:hypothetical protein